MAIVVDAAPVQPRGGPGPRIAGHLQQAASLLREALRGVAELEPAEAVEVAPLFADAARIAEAGTLRCARTAGDHGARRFAGERDAASLFSSVSKTSLRKAKSGLDAAEKLDAAPEASQALWDGDLSLDQAVAIAPVAVRAPHAAGTLIETARRSSIRELKEEAARALRCEEAEAAVVERERRIYGRRHCRTWVDEAGAVRLDALLAPKDGARVVRSLDVVAQRLGRVRRRAGAEVSIEHLRADALVELVRGALESRPRAGERPATARVGGSGDEDPGGGVGDREGVAGSGGLVGCGEPQVLVRVDAAALQRGAVARDEICEIAGIGPVSVRVARELLCEGFLTLLVTDGVDVRTVTSTTRTVPARVHKALLLRDVHCVVPGCGATERLEIDHWRRDFSWRGSTELTNLCRLCPSHHAMKTRTGWRLAGGPGRWRWLPPRTIDELARSHGVLHGRGTAGTTGRQGANGAPRRGAAARAAGVSRAGAARASGAGAGARAGAGAHLHDHHGREGARSDSESGAGP